MAFVIGRPRPVSLWPRRAPLGTALAALLALASLPTAAHPHVFVEAAATFVMDAKNRLVAMRIENRYDPLLSLFVLTELGVDPFAPLSKRDVAQIAAKQALPPEDADGFAVLTVERDDIALGAPELLNASMEGDRLAIAFTMSLIEPPTLTARKASLAVFDPLHFIAFAMTGAVAVQGGEGCAAAVVELEPTDDLHALQASLLDLAPDKVPDNPTVGRLFAATARVTCR